MFYVALGIVLLCIIAAIGVLLFSVRDLGKIVIQHDKLVHELQADINASQAVLSVHREELLKLQRRVNQLIQ